ncbi:hypothetical protein PLESTB_000856400 [Pleodorina starrii]|uniref:Protein kinase domain-containing protein n=1 Tax=Pleodorina starrii TaxID=330485 RepID=A0A9W6BLZ6_9CHLO|nr:hypothetical protein PLESTM_001437400 [Pleodorina starrii]GLC54368.1 hypothetical protein PLESTB_000856400 [Pleodorina starrii]GLC72019.1 hypothetical protein PLESTF_001195600 [Pleodorina starrii]
MKAVFQSCFSGGVKPCRADTSSPCNSVVAGSADGLVVSSKPSAPVPPAARCADGTFTEGLDTSSSSSPMRCCDDQQRGCQQQRLDELLAAIGCLQHENGLLTRTVSGLQGELSQLWAVVTKLQQAQQQQQQWYLPAIEGPVVAASSASSVVSDSSAAATDSDVTSEVTDASEPSTTASTASIAVFAEYGTTASSTASASIAIITASPTTAAIANDDDSAEAASDSSSAACCCSSSSAAVADDEAATTTIICCASSATDLTVPPLDPADHSPAAFENDSDSDDDNSGNHFPVIIDSDTNTAADSSSASGMKLLGKRPRSPCDSAAFCLVLGPGESKVVAKSFPFYSQERAEGVVAEAAAKGQETVRGVRQDGAMCEATTVHNINSASAALDAAAAVEASAAADGSGAAAVLGRNVFVPPLMVLNRPCSRAASSGDDSGLPMPDREVVMVYPFLEGGNALEYLRAVSQSLGSSLAASLAADDSPAAANLRRQEVVAALRELFLDITTQMFVLMARVHQLGYVMRDHKLENMAVDADESEGSTRRPTLYLIDAAEVRRCELGQQLPGASPHTALYASPEQRQKRWVDSRSDVYCAVKSMRWAQSEMLLALEDALGEDSEATAEAEAELKAELLPVMRELSPGAAADPEARPSAKAILEKLTQLRL